VQGLAGGEEVGEIVDSSGSVFEGGGEDFSFGGTPGGASSERTEAGKGWKADSSARRRSASWVRWPGNQACQETRRWAVTRSVRVRLASWPATWPSDWPWSARRICSSWAMVTG